MYLWRAVAPGLCYAWPRLARKTLSPLAAALAHLTPFRSPLSFAKVSTNSGEAHRRHRHGL
jgi:hypothetical protein